MYLPFIFFPEKIFGKTVSGPYPCLVWKGVRRGPGALVSSAGVRYPGFAGIWFPEICILSMAKRVLEKFLKKNFGFFTGRFAFGSFVRRLCGAVRIAGAIKKPLSFFGGGCRCMSWIPGQSSVSYSGMSV